MSWHHEPTTGIHTRHPTPDLTKPFTAADALNLTDKQLRHLAAVHEAGHAAIHLHHGVPFDDMGIGNDPTRNQPCGGYIHATNVTCTLNEFAHLQTGGERASDRLLHDLGLWTPARAWANELAARTDRLQLAEHMPTDDLTAVHADVDRILDQMWPQVLRIAIALDRHGRLDYAQAAAAAGYAPLGR